jgi:hypothetical protein
MRFDLPSGRGDAGPTLTAPTAPPAPSPPAAPAAPPRRSAMADGAAIRFEELGEPSPVVLPRSPAPLEVPAVRACAHAEAAALRWSEQQPD